MYDRSVLDRQVNGMSAATPQPTAPPASSSSQTSDNADLEWLLCLAATLQAVQKPEKTYKVKTNAA